MIVGFIVGLLKFVLLMSFLVLIHEAGHFLTAKAVGIKVDEFAIGFGPILWSKQWGETKYSVRWVLLGGYVSMDGEVEKSDNPRAFNNKPLWARILVVLMGGLVNIAFAVVTIFIIVVSAGQFETTTIDELLDGSAGQIAGLQEGDTILAINNKKMRVKDDITEYLRINKQQPVVVTVLRNGEKLDFSFTPDVQKIGYIGVEYVEEGEISTNEVKSVQVDSPAVNAGIKAGDKIIGINGKDTADIYEIDTVLKASADKEVVLKVQRDSELLDVNITPVCPEILERYVIGFYGTVSSNKLDLVKHAFWQSKAEVVQMMNQVTELLTGKISAKYLSGPVGVATVIGKTDFGMDLLTLAVFISLNLGIVNLLPVPPLDGGKIVFLLIEGITRRPVSEKVEYYFQLAGFALLIMLMLFVTFNDITRRLSIF